jgi:hypothetical protein
MDLVISDEARGFVKDHGGTAFVTAHRHGCCTGALTLLDVTTEIPVDKAEFESVDGDGVRVRFSGGPSGRPHKLVIELRGRSRRHPVAYWAAAPSSSRVPRAAKILSGRHVHPVRDKPFCPPGTRPDPA